MVRDKNKSNFFAELGAFQVTALNFKPQKMMFHENKIIYAQCHQHRSWKEQQP